MPDFPDKVTIPCLKTLSPNYWLSGMTRLSLDLVTDSVIQRALEISTEKAMATHSSTLAWRIPWAEEPGRLQSMGS